MSESDEEEYITIEVYGRPLDHMTKTNFHQQQPDSTNPVDPNLAINTDPDVMEQEVVIEQHTDPANHFFNSAMNIDSILSGTELTAESIDLPDQNIANAFHFSVHQYVSAPLNALKERA